MATREQTYDTHEYVFNRVLTRAYVLNWEFVAYAVILVLALVTRFADLGARVMSHDESLHTYYSWRLAEYGEFSHTPLMHGPVLFHMVALSYFLFGDNDFTARIYPAVLGVLIVLFPLLTRRWLGRVGAVIASVMLLISPMMMYYNRYIREDTPSVFFTIVFVYAALQYFDGERPRRPVWLWVMSGALLLTLASKEVAFMYIAIFGSILTLFWLMRVLQDIGIQRRPAAVDRWRPPVLQQVLGHAILLALVGAFAVPLGELIRYLLSATLWIPHGWWIDLSLFLVIYVPLALSGMVGSIRPGKHKRDEIKNRSGDGAASAIMQWLARGTSALRIVMTGVIIGVLVTLLIICVLDIIKPTTAANVAHPGIRTYTTVMSTNDRAYGANVSKEYAVSYAFNGAMFVRAATWIGLPVLGVLFVLFLTAVLKFPGHLPLPWRDMLLIVLIAIITTSGLVLFERRSFIQEASAQPFAADPNVAASSDGEDYNNTPIIVAWVLGTLITLAVVASRVFTGIWDFLNRQPIFDVLIVIGTLVLPWLAAFPLYWAGYNLEDYNANTTQGRDTLNAALVTFIPFAMVSVSVGLVWNWKRWLPAAAVFIGLFAFFFTTVFSNQYGLATGLIGSLGYWLEQQEVRRGSQPQYYYILTQLPVYEFLPMIGAMGASLLGLSRLWAWRRERIEADQQEQVDYANPGEDALLAEPDREAEIEVPNEAEFPQTVSRFFRPFDLQEEQAHRAEDPEWIGSFPFLTMVGYWAVAILLSLTVAGEKMPWLTTHITVPLVLVSGWWLGNVVTSIRWRALRDGGWLTLIVMMPLAFLALAQVLVPLWGSGGPFRGREIENLAESGNWLAALLILLGTLYVIGRFGRRLGLRQLGHMAIVSGAVLLAILTARTAYMASFVHYDYATEYLVYAHAGPAIKTVLAEVDRIAEITNEGHSMRIVFDDESSWPYTWYFRHYSNYGYMAGESGSVNPSTLDGARVVVVGNKKAAEVRQILGDRYYEFGYIRLWWPMQEYFNLNYDRVANVFSTDPANVAAEYYRQGIFDIWWDRDYSTYAQAMCIEGKQTRCVDEATWGETQDDRDRLRRQCERAVVAECRNDQRFAVNNWPVSDRMYFFVDKQIAAQVWDAGIGSSTVDIREPEYPEDQVFREIEAERTLGETAGLKGPRGIAVDGDGLLYIADTENNRILVLDQDGSQVTSLGGSGVDNDPAALRQPWGVAVGPDGNVYVADTWNHRVAVFAADGELLRAWGHEGLPAQGDVTVDAFWGPRDVAIGLDGNVYVADTGNKRIRVYTPEGDFVRDIGLGGANFGQLDEPVGLAFNPVSGELFVADVWNKRIQVFNANGVPVREWPVNMWFGNQQSYNRPYLAVSPDGTLVYTVDMDDRHRIVAYDLNGVPQFSFNHPDDLEANFLGLRLPAGLAFDAAGRFYVVDASQNKVFVFPPSDMRGGVQPIPQLDMQPGAAEATEEAPEG